MKNKPLMPSLREKKRYIAFEVLSKARTWSKDSVNKEIISTIEELFGKMAAAEAGIRMITFNKEKQRGILRVNNKYSDHIKTSFLFTGRIGSDKAVIQSLKTSGILKKVKPIAS